MRRSIRAPDRTSSYCGVPEGSIRTGRFAKMAGGYGFGSSYGFGGGSCGDWLFPQPFGFSGDWLFPQPFGFSGGAVPWNYRFGWGTPR